VTTLKDEPQLADFIRHEQSGVLSIVIDSVGTVHNAAITYWHQENPLKFYYITDRNSEKCKMLLTGNERNAGFVVGTVIDTPFTLQLRGKCKIVDKNKHSDIINGYIKKRGNDHGIKNSEKVLIEFKPDWARFTDYSKGWQTHMIKL
jgi:uncharacterized protein YhbP (UPF0306 family)